MDRQVFWQINYLHW